MAIGMAALSSNIGKAAEPITDRISDSSMAIYIGQITHDVKNIVRRGRYRKKAVVGSVSNRQIQRQVRPYSRPVTAGSLDNYSATLLVLS